MQTSAAAAPDIETDTDTPEPADDLAGPTPADLLAQQQLNTRRKNHALQRPRRGFAQRW